MAVVHRFINSLWTTAHVFVDETGHPVEDTPNPTRHARNYAEVLANHTVVR